MRVGLATFFVFPCVFRRKVVFLHRKALIAFAIKDMKIQVLDEKGNVLSESETRISSPARARLVRVKSMRLDGPRHKMEVVPWSAVFPNT